MALQFQRYIGRIEGSIGRRRGKEGADCIKSIIARKAFAALSRLCSLSYSFLLLLLRRLMRAQGVSSAVMRDTKGMTVSFLNVMYVTLFDKGDNLVFLREIEILDLLNYCSDNYLHG